jgi:glycerol kinase
MEADAGIRLAKLNVDGGASVNSILMQFQADILGCNVERPAVVESTAMGAAYLAGLAVGWWSKDEILKHRAIDRTFEPAMSVQDRERLYKGWKKAVERCRNWIDND